LEQNRWVPPSFPVPMTPPHMSSIFDKALD
jgi:hypothetical protein